MSNHKHYQNLLIGSAVAVAGILGTLTGILGHKKNGSRWSKQAKNIMCKAMESGEHLNKKMILGGVAGGLIGAATALLLAPKSGSDLRKDIAHPFLHQGSYLRKISNKLNLNKSASHKKASPKKKSSPHQAKSTVVNKTRAKVSEAKSHKHTPSKKSPNRIPISSNISKVSLALEKAANQVRGM